MTREEAKDIVFNYALGQKINDGINTLDEIIDQIFDYFGEQLQNKDDEIERLKDSVQQWHIRSIKETYDMATNRLTLCRLHSRNSNDEI